jgi:hypothetical protein
MRLIKAANVYAPSNLNCWKKKGFYIAQKIHQQNSLEGYHITRVYIEMPAFFESSEGAMVARKGDLVKLTWFVGLLCGMFYPIPTELIEVNKWKGQLPKEVVERRIKKIDPAYHNLKSHSYDAVGIGLYVKGEF